MNPKKINNMKLLLETTENSHFAVAFGAGKKVKIKVVEKPYSQSELLLTTIKKILGDEKPQEIFVIDGPGQFSALRTGIACANALAFAYEIPVFGLRLEKKWQELAEMDRMKAIWQKICSGEFIKLKGDFVKPFYDKEPNITKSL